MISIICNLELSYCILSYLTDCNMKLMSLIELGLILGRDILIIKKYRISIFHIYLSVSLYIYLFIFIYLLESYHDLFIYSVNQ